MIESSNVVVALYSDERRIRQLGRLRRLIDKIGRYVQLPLSSARIARGVCGKIHAQLPADVRKALRLPSVQVFAEVLGLMVTARRLGMRRLELSTQEIGALIGRDKSTVCAVLRWLGEGPIEYRGERWASGLGWLHRARRTGHVRVDGQDKNYWRTSTMVITDDGRAELGIRDDGKLRRPRKRRAQGNQQRNKRPPRATGPPPASLSEDSDLIATAYGRHKLREIIQAIG